MVEVASKCLRKVLARVEASSKHLWEVLIKVEADLASKKKRRKLEAVKAKVDFGQGREEG